MTGLTKEVYYEFKVEARNTYDYSDFSESLTLLCAYIPETPVSVTTALEGNQIKIEWALPSDNGSPITAYKVFVQVANTDTYIEETNDCVGTDPTVIANQYCYVQISTLIAEPYNFDGGDSIYAKVSAVNQYGESS